MDSQTQTLVHHISNTESFEKLEMTISMLLFGWVIDDQKENKGQYEDLIKLSVDRLNFLCMLKGKSHPLQNIDLVRDKTKIEMSVMMSTMKSVIDIEKKKMDIFDVSMN